MMMMKVPFTEDGRFWTAGAGKYGPGVADSTVVPGLPCGVRGPTEARPLGLRVASCLDGMKLIGTIGWSVVMAMVTPAAASRPGLASDRLRSSTLDRLVNSGPMMTGICA